MATGREILARHMARTEAAMPRAANDADHVGPPTGYIVFGDRHMAVWLPRGVSPESLGLTTFSRHQEASH